MSARRITREALRTLLGGEVAVSPWLTVSQERILQFADASGDRQWIHVDEARARAESPYGTTIAHGFLSLSLLSQLKQQAFELVGYGYSVNYGCNRVRFTGPVPAGSEVRARFVLGGLETVAATGDHSEGDQCLWSVTLERNGAPGPVMIAEWLTRHYL